MSGELTSLDSNGFTLGSNENVNQSSQTYAAWCFNAGTDAAASNTDGSITSTVKANQDAGFSIVKWNSSSTASDTIGSGLDERVEFLLTKKLNGSRDWHVWHKDLPNNGYLNLNSTIAEATPNGNRATVTNDNTFIAESTSGDSMIAYCYHSVDGIQKVGSYTGTGAAGNIIETGFEPAFVMIKCSSAANGWIIWDNKRGGDKSLFPHSSTSEVSSTYDIDFASNGFIIQSTNTPENASGQTYIYLAIAADPDTTTPTVEDSFEVVTYTGNGGTQSIDVGFKPDFVWLKNGDTSNFHALVNSVVGENYIQYTNSSSAGETNSAIVASLDSNGFTVGAEPTSNGSGNELVAYAWKAGDHDDSLPQINTEGTIDSIVSVNDAAGFSIVKYTAGGTATVGHGLSSAPELIITKNLDISEQWFVYAEPVGYQKFLGLNTTSAPTSNSGVYTDVNATTYTNNISSTSRTYINYCFTSITGYQKIGSYQGTGATGNAVTTGFSPRFVMIKDYTNAGNWIIHSKPPTTTNPSTKHLRPNSSAGYDSGAGEQINFDSNGFTIVGTGGNVNTNNDVYLYLAIA